MYKRQVFRLSISSILLVPLALPDPGHARAVVLVLYTIGFFSAGLVTPGLEHMVLGIAPQGCLLYTSRCV